MSQRFGIAIVAVVSLAAFESAPLGAQVEIDRRRPAPARGEVSIDNDFGTIAVKGWERNEVWVQGIVAAGAEGFDLDGDKEGTSVSVSVPDAWFQAAGEAPAFRSTLTVHVPMASHLSIESVNAVVSVDGVGGAIDVETVNGGVRISGARGPVEVETMTGAIDVVAAGSPMEIRSISGAVTVSGATGEVQIETVSGKVVASGEGVSSVDIRTTTGPVEFQGSTARQGDLQVETFSSPVKLRLPKGTKATFDLQTFGAKIESQFCTGTPVTRRRFEPFRELRCSTGPEEFEIHVRTHDADIVIEAQ